MHRLLAILACVWIVSAPAFAADIPRPAPETSFSLPDGRKINLNDYRGKIVVVEVMLTTCPICQRTSTVIEKLYEEYGDKGFQPLGIAMNDDTGDLVSDYVKEHNITFPIGFAPRDVALSLLQYSMMNAQMFFPNLVIIDREGVIQAQIEGTDDFFRNPDANVRRLVESILDE